KCLNPDWRHGSVFADLFDGREPIAGRQVTLWIGKGDGNACTYVVEPADASAPVPFPDQRRDLQDFPEFWSLDIPLARPTLPLSSPHSQAEADWLTQQFPNETGSDSPGLVLAEFNSKANPQMEWKYWSRHTDDLIPWATGQPAQAPPGATKGRLILRDRKCSVVFDTTMRPRLCGGNQMESTGWAVHAFTWSRMELTSRYLAGEISESDFDQPEFMKKISGQYGDYRARECVAYSPEAVESHAPWRLLEKDIYHLDLVQRMLAKTNTGESIPFKRLDDRRVLVTSIVCSRELAEKIAEHHGARLPMPGQEKAEALAALLPDSMTVHSAQLTPDAPSRALLVLEWPDTGDRKRTVH
ncbi:MAG: hypothetical protein KDN22_19785, partial [Verrucomicrobiae bacterium]|nr:hypothetical protein [Verrucomicrobiae bacterium]